MIKIIISGTSDGFYPRYATDGKLDDAVSQNLLDRRRFLSREADRLDKEGYCFQVLDNTGILFHKILLLYDGFGRDGFMMASLFLPKDKTLTGKEIKETLDSIVKDYKTLTINGMANFDLDWSFVKQKADELEKKVQNVTWKKQSSHSDASCTALLKGADDMITDYFQYPNPLHKGFDGFGLVFLSETILDLSKESADGHQGYKVLTKDDVDIANPEYKIELLGQFQQNGSYSGKRHITKKELSEEGDIKIGTYSKSGYRSADVYIKGDEKVSKDNLTIAVTLPALEQKLAVVELIVVDKSKNNAPIPNYNITIDWNTSYKTSRPEKQDDGKYLFRGESCDVVWEYTIKCGNLFDTYSDQITVEDGKNVTKEIALAPKPLWSIDYILPDGSISSYGNGGYPNDAIDIQTDAAKQWLKLMGYDTVDTNKDKKSNKVTLTCEKHIDEDWGYVTKPKEPSKTDEFSDGIDDRAIETDCKSQEPKRKRFYLQLDSKSQDYLLFKNYRKRLSLDKKISESLQQLEKQIKAWEHDCAQYDRLPEKNRKKWEGRILLERKLFELFSGIIDAFKESKSEKVKSLLEQFPSDYINSGAGRDWLYKIDNTIEYVKKRNLIPNVVISPNDITYNDTEHRLECERAETPSNTERIEFAKDRYVYSISNPVWEKDGKWNKQTNVVNRKLLPKYNVMRIAIPVVVILAIMIVLSLFLSGGDAYKSYKENITLMLNKCNELSYNEQAGITTRYVGDIQYQKLDSLRNEVRQFVNENEKYTDSLQIAELERECERQKYLKGKDSVCYNECKRLLDSFPHNNYLPDIENPALSKEHYEELRVLYSKASEKWTADKENYKKLCLSELGTVQNIKDYFDKFGKDQDLGRRLVDIAQNTSKESKDRLDACDIYLTYWSKGTSQSLINGIKRQLSGIGESNTSLRRTTHDDTKSQDIKQNRKETENFNKTEDVQSNVEKTKLGTPGIIFNQLLWDNVKNNGKGLFKTYDIDERFKNRVDNLIKKANEVGRVKYTNAYSKVSKMTPTQIGKEDKLHYLEKELLK